MATFDFNALPASDGMWNAARSKGDALLKMMRGTDSEAGQLFSPQRQSAASPFKDFPKEFEDWGYVCREDYGFESDMKFVGLTEALDGLGVSAESKIDGGPLYCWKIQHLNAKAVGDSVYLKTDADYTVCMNAHEGLIIGLSLFSPAHQGQKQNPPVTLFPELRHSSDLIWGQWKLHAEDIGADVRSIQYYIVNAIENGETQQVLRRALDSINAMPLKKWPGDKFDVDTDADAVKAILGTPIGQIVGYLLAQHKAELGDKVIKSVDVFGPEESNENPSLVFHIVDRK